jgi:hypothetical protein
MNRQKCKYTMRRLSGETTPHGIAEVHTCTGVAVPTHISPAVHTCCRVATKNYFRDETGRHTAKSVMKRIYKSIFIHLLKDSNQ